MPSPTGGATTRRSPGSATKRSSPSKGAATNRAAASNSPSKGAATSRAAASKARPPTTKELAQFGYSVLGPIAAGTFSTVVKAKNKESGTEVAIKTFAKCSPTQAAEHERELQILRLLSEVNHAHIANLIAEYDASGGGKHVILFYCKGGSLQRYLAKLRKKEMAMAEELAAVCTAQIASALGFLHANGIAHRDIKPANILYDGRRWRLCDFGFAIACEPGEKLTQKLGSIAYSAPELLGESGYLGPCVDMWALGCTVYEMRVGRVCFVGDVSGDVDGVKLRIKKGFKGGTEAFPWLPHMTREQKQLITSLLAPDASQRLTAEQVLHSAWIEKTCAPEAGGGEATEATGAGSSSSSSSLLDELSSSSPTTQTLVKSWWCDVAGAGCLRPVEGSYNDDEHRCWRYEEAYMVCEVCYRRKDGVEHYDQLKLVSGPPLGEEEAEVEVGSFAVADLQAQLEA